MLYKASFLNFIDEYGINDPTFIELVTIFHPLWYINKPIQSQQIGLTGQKTNTCALRGPNWPFSVYNPNPAWHIIDLTNMYHTLTIELTIYVWLFCGFFRPGTIGMVEFHWLWVNGQVSTVAWNDRFLGCHSHLEILGSVGQVWLAVVFDYDFNSHHVDFHSVWKNLGGRIQYVTVQWT